MRKRARRNIGAGFFGVRRGFGAGGLTLDVDNQDHDELDDVAEGHAGPQEVRWPEGEPNDVPQHLTLDHNQRMPYHEGSRQAGSFDAYYAEEYQRILPRLTEAYERTTPDEQERIQEMDAQFENGQRDALIAWAKTIVPDAFASPREGPEPAPERDEPDVEVEIAEELQDLQPLEELPSGGPFYHGTRDLQALFTQGLCAPTAELASGDPEYGFEAVWKDELFNSYKNQLEPAQRKQLSVYFGDPRPIRKRELGNLFSLFWVSRNLKEAESYGDVVEVDLTQLKYFWWFPDEIAGKGAYVFVMPTSCPQAPPRAFKLVQRRKRGAAGELRVPRLTDTQLGALEVYIFDPAHAEFGDVFPGRLEGRTLVVDAGGLERARELLIEGSNSAGESQDRYFENALMAIVRKLSALTRTAGAEDGPLFKAAVERAKGVIAQIEAQRAALGSTDEGWIPPQFYGDLVNAKYKLFQHGPRWADTVVRARAIPEKQHKAVEMAARLFARASVPKDFVKWFKTNAGRLELLAAAVDWPERGPAAEGGADAFPLGGFEVHNTVGSSGKTLEDTKAVIERAVNGLGAVGMRDMAYGPLYLVGQIAHENHAAWYKAKDDVVYLRPLVKGLSIDESARHLAHELGHRYWAKKMGAAAKKAWVEHHGELTYRNFETPTPEVGAPIANLVVNQKPAAFGGYEGAKAVIVNAKDGSRIGLVDRFKLAQWLREAGRMSLFPTSYAAKDAEEHFCESVSLAAQGKLTGEHAEALARVLGTERTAEMGVNLKELDRGRVDGPVGPYEDWDQAYTDDDQFEEQDNIHLGALTKEEAARMTDEQLQSLPTEELDRVAFGFASGDVLTLDPLDIRVVYDADFENATAAVTRRNAREWLARMEAEPVSVKLKNGQLQLEDGHHRYQAARLLGAPVKAVVDIDDNPILALRRQAQRKRGPGEYFYGGPSVPGRVASRVAAGGFEQEGDALEDGARVEMEHTDDWEEAEDIAEDHLEERDDYYDVLSVVEDEDVSSPEPGVLEFEEPESVEVRAQRRRQPWVAVDLDGTILSEEPGMAARGEFGEVLPGAVDALRELQSLGWRISIYTARFDSLDPVDAAGLRERISSELERQGVPFTDVWVGPKPRADWFIDNKALHFDGDWNEMLLALTSEGYSPKHEHGHDGGTGLIDTVDNENDFGNGPTEDRRDRSLRRPPDVEEVLY